MRPSNNISVLYVDDEEPNLFLFKITFQDRYHVYTAKSANEGLNLLDEKSNEISVVISDMHMPMMNGVQFVKKAKERFENLDYFILTGFEFNEEIERALQEGLIKKCLTKPYDSSQLEKAFLEDNNN
jgi:response regulator RpfG family c-di-GMP phosphodiesterase